MPKADRIPKECLLIEEDQQIGILLPVEYIPTGSTVRKRTGEKDYTFVIDLDVYPASNPQDEVLHINGFFIIDAAAHINQLAPTTMMIWVVDAYDFNEYLTARWESDCPQ